MLSSKVKSLAIKQGIAFKEAEEKWQLAVKESLSLKAVEDENLTLGIFKKLIGIKESEEDLNKLLITKFLESKEKNFTKFIEDFNSSSISQENRPEQPFNKEKDEIEEELKESEVIDFTNIKGVLNFSFSVPFSTIQKDEQTILTAEEAYTFKKIYQIPLTEEEMKSNDLENIVISKAIQLLTQETK